MYDHSTFVHIFLTSLLLSLFLRPCTLIFNSYFSSSPQASSPDMVAIMYCQQTIHNCMPCLRTSWLNSKNSWLALFELWLGLSVLKITTFPLINSLIKYWQYILTIDVTVASIKHLNFETCRSVLKRKLLQKQPLWLKQNFQGGPSYSGSILATFFN